MNTAAFSVLALIAVPSAVFMVIWAAVTAARILFPERALHRPRPLRRAEARNGSIPVGFREIHDALPRHARRVVLPHRSYAGPPAGRLEPWEEDLWRRRN